MRFPKLLIKEVEETFTQENFKRVEDYFRLNSVDRCGLEFLEIEIPGAVTSEVFPHFLGYTPKDILTIHNYNNATITYHFDKFDSTNLYITSSGATTLRLLIGRYL